MDSFHPISSKPSSAIAALQLNWADAELDRAVVRIAEKHVALYPGVSAGAALAMRAVEERFLVKYRSAVMILRTLLEMGQGPETLRKEWKARKLTFRAKVKGGKATWRKLS